MSGYYNRGGTPVGDGTISFLTDEDERNEGEVARMLEARWRCELHPFGKLSPIDWYATRHGRIEAVAELKTRSHGSDRFPTVFLNVRKWLALSLAEVGLGVPALFAVSFSDGVRWIRVQDVDASRVRLGGCSRIVKSNSDIEPVIEVPISQMLTP